LVAISRERVSSGRVEGEVKEKVRWKPALRRMQERVGWLAVILGGGC
jgi:hypothetical protein